jgi:hypothetical protein
MPGDDLEQFEHFHGDGIKNLELEKARLEQERLKVNLLNLDDALLSTLTAEQVKLDKAAQGPEAVFKQALHSLNEVEAKRFVILNALEAVKRGEGISKILQRYGDMGLIPARAPAPTDPDIGLLAGTCALLARKSIWERVATTVAQLAVNALKTVPKWVEIEPHFGFVGPVPMLSFSLKGKGLTIHEFLEALLKSRQVPSTPQ